MIKSITISNVNSYKENSTISTDKYINLFYGLNGTGKSTISRYLNDINNYKYKDCCVEGLDNENLILVYNQDFINENFYEQESIKGIFTLSKTNADNKSAIDNLINDKNKLSEAKNKLEEEKNKAENSVKIKKEQCQEKLWQLKNKCEKSYHTFATYLKGFRNSKEALFDFITNKVYDDKYDNKDIQQLAERAKQLENPQTTREIFKEFSLNISDIEEHYIFKKVIVGSQNSSLSSLIEKLNNADWVKQGLDILNCHQDINQCPFCQQETISDNFINNLQLYFDKEYEKDLSLLSKVRDNYKQSVNGFIEYINKIIQSSDVNCEKEKLLHILSEIIIVFKDNLYMIETKIDSPSQIIELNSITEYYNDVKNIVIKINKENENFNNSIKNTQACIEKNKFEYYYFLYKNIKPFLDSYLQEDLDFKKEKYRDKFLELQNKIDQAEDEIKQLQASIENIDESINAINDELINLGIIDFRIEKDITTDNMYRLVRTEDTSNVFRSLSEGEKTLISFLYFIQLCKSETATVQRKNKIIIIDDPVSSLSHNNLYNIAYIIKNTFFYEKKFNQLFVLTHSLYFFHELIIEKRFRKADKCKLFRVCKNRSTSFISKIEFDEIQNDYQYYWQIVKDKDNHPIVLANCWRNIIEYFFTFITSENISKLYNSEKFKNPKMQGFFRFINRESHSDAVNLCDLKDFDYDNFSHSFKDVFETLGYIDHYNKMME